MRVQAWEVAAWIVIACMVCLAAFTQFFDAFMPVGRCDAATVASAPASDSAEIRRLCQQARH